MRYLLNTAVRGAAYGAAQQALLNRAACEAAWRELTAWPAYVPTPLVELPGLAARLGVEALACKDEGKRFGQGSFKALGGAYAVYRVLEGLVAERRPGVRVTSEALRAGAWREDVEAVTVTCASAGNHGRSVAWGAAQFGCRCVIYVADNVDAARVEGITRYGAGVERVAGTYDDAVRRAAEDAARRGWHVVSDTSYPGYADVPCVVMQGYTILAEEVVRTWPRPTHVFLQCGVGGLAAAVCAHFRQTWGADCPRVVVVEPEAAACMYESARDGRPTHLDGDLATSMVCLACGDVSLQAWEILRTGAHAFMTITDAAEDEVLALLRAGVAGDPALALHGSGGAGVAGVLSAVRDEEIRFALGLDAQSRILTVGSEGGQGSGFIAGE